MKNSTKLELIGGKEPKRLGWHVFKIMNRAMMMKRREWTYEECMEVDMSPAQREVFLIIDEWWKRYGYSPSIRDIAYQRGRSGLGNTLEIVDRLVAKGVLKKLKKSGRSIRPVYINFRNLE
jgi:hypothetical protein